MTELYIYNNRVVDIAKNVIPEDEGAIEVTSINQNYIELYVLQVKSLGFGLLIWIQEHLMP